MKDHPCPLPPMLVALCLMLAIASIASAKPALDPQFRRAAQIKAILEIAGDSADLLQPLRESRKVLATAPERYVESLEPLIDALLRGVSDEALARVLVENYNIDDDGGFRNEISEIYGSNSSRLQLHWLLWEKAKQQHAHGNAESAARYARAALLLLAHEDFVAAVAILGLLREPGFADIAGLDAQQRKAMEAWRVREQQDADHAAESIGSAIDIIWKMAGQERLELDACEQAIALLDAARPHVRTWGQTHRLVHVAWRFRNLAVVRNDAEVQRRIDVLLTSWQAEASAPVRRWLEQAMTTTGPPPILLDPSKIKMEIEVNGQWVPLGLERK